MAQFFCTGSALRFSGSTLDLKALVVDWEIGAFALVMVGVFSNRLLLIQFVLPLGLVLLGLLLMGRFKGFPFEGFSSFVSYGFILLGSILGYLQYVLSFRQCSEMQVGSASALSTLVAAFSANQVLLLPVLLFGLGSTFVLIGFVVFLCSDFARLDLRLRAGMADWSAILLFVGLVVVLGALAYFQLDLDLANRTYWRYLIVPTYASLFGSALVIVLLLERLTFSFSPWLERKAIGLESLTGFAVVPASLLFAALASVSVESVSRSQSYVSVYGPQDSWLNSLLARTGLTARLGFVADPPWESRRLSLVSEGAISALSVSSDGNPLIYPHSRQQFIVKGASVDPMSPRPDEVSSPSWVLASPQDFDRMKAFYGEPLYVIGCFEKKVVFIALIPHRLIRTLLSFCRHGTQSDTDA